jgi:hypothetical protein
MADNEHLIALKEAEVAAATTLNYWAVHNTYGKTVAELVEIDVGYRCAEAQWLRARAAYLAALEEVVR